MSIFNRRYEKLEDDIRNREVRNEGLKKLKNENLGGCDIFALIIAMFQLIIPIALGITVIYFLAILFITKFWMR